MKAVVKKKRGSGNVKLVEVDVPKIGAMEVLIEVKSTGICGTDVHIFHDLAFYEPPVTLGHEYAGVIVETGKEVKDFKVGDIVTSPATIPCRTCYMCRINQANRCVGETKRILGTYRADGTFAKYVAVPERVLHKIPENISFDEAAVAEPAACAVHSVTETVGVNPGDVVVVLGPGTMGLLSIQVAKIAGAKKVIITGVDADIARLRLAEKLGVDLTVNVQNQDPLEVVKSVTGGLGADVVLEASGASAARKQALTLVRKCGRIGIIGLSGKPVKINLDRIVEGELVVKGSWGTIWTSWSKALEMMSLGMIQVGPLITEKFPLERWREGFRMMEERKALKVLFNL